MNTSTTLAIHLRDGKIVGKVEHQQHDRSDGPYPVVTVGLGSFEFTVYPDRERALELADTLARMADELRAGAERFAVQALAD